MCDDINIDECIIKTCYIVHFGVILKKILCHSEGYIDFVSG